MRMIEKLTKYGVLSGLLALASGCIVTPREGYYDHDHHRYYHEHAWHECAEHDDYCHR